MLANSTYEVALEPVVEVATTTEVVIIEERNFQKENPVLYAICTCESGIFGNGPSHFEKDGVTVLTGRIDRRDTGMCQINTHYHLSASKSLGYDIFDEEDNWDYAKYLFDKQGTQPWTASKQCWSKRI